ncbi:MAG: CDP-alcohol phosphatidyltransferase family protein, partial [Planctomycetota bacterium]
PETTQSITSISPWMVIAILSRELLVTTIRGACESKGIDFSATLSGKLKMIVQSIAIPLILIVTAYTDFSTGMILSDSSIDNNERINQTYYAVQRSLLINSILAHTVVVVTIWSAIPYTVRGYKGLRNLDQQSKAGRTDH